MSASLGHSITALLPADASDKQREKALVAVSRACPEVLFFDVVGDHVVRVERGKLQRVEERPAHAGATITRDVRELFWMFEDHGDLLLPGWDPERDEYEVDLGGDQPRVLGDLATFAREVDACLGDEEVDADAKAFLRTVRDAVKVAIDEHLPLVAHW